MNRYANYCTEEQVKKAFELGAPIIRRHIYEDRVIPYPHGEFVVEEENS